MDTGINGTWAEVGTSTRNPRGRWHPSSPRIITWCRRRFKRGRGDRLGPFTRWGRSPERWQFHRRRGNRATWWITSSEERAYMVEISTWKTPQAQLCLLLSPSFTSKEERHELGISRSNGVLKAAHKVVPFLFYSLIDPSKCIIISSSASQCIDLFTASKLPVIYLIQCPFLPNSDTWVQNCLICSSYVILHESVIFFDRSMELNRRERFIKIRRYNEEVMREWILHFV